MCFKLAIGTEYVPELAPFAGTNWWLKYGCLDDLSFTRLAHGRELK